MNAIKTLLAKATDLLIIDDSSPDGTGSIVDKLAAHCDLVHVMHRPAKAGLGCALGEGFRWAVDQGYSFITNMDGDLSHDPTEVHLLLRAVQNADAAVGSRYIGGTRVSNWPLHRLLLSRFAGTYIRSITGMPVADPTSGFRSFRADALRRVLARPFLSSGFSFHIEILHRIWSTGGHIKEVPIHFKNRLNGQTKIGANIVFEACWVTPHLRWPRLPYGWRKKSN